MKLINDIKAAYYAFINDDDSTEMYGRFFYYIGCVTFLLGIIVIIWIVKSDYNLDDIHGSCFILSKTGYYCTGCGGTRAVLFLLKGDIVNSFKYHPLVICCIIYYLLIMISHTLSIVFKGRFKGIIVRFWHIMILVLIMILQWMVKNLLVIVFNQYII